MRKTKKRSYMRTNRLQKLTRRKMQSRHRQRTMNFLSRKKERNHLFYHVLDRANSLVFKRKRNCKSQYA